MKYIKKFEIKQGEIKDIDINKFYTYTQGTETITGKFTKIENNRKNVGYFRGCSTSSLLKRNIGAFWNVKISGRGWYDIRLATNEEINIYETIEELGVEIYKDLKNFNL